MKRNAKIWLVIGIVALALALFHVPGNQKPSNISPTPVFEPEAKSNRVPKTEQSASAEATRQSDRPEAFQSMVDILRADAMAQAGDLVPNMEIDLKMEDRRVAAETFATIVKELSAEETFNLNITPISS